MPNKASRVREFEPFVHCSEVFSKCNADCALQSKWPSYYKLQDEVDYGQNWSDDGAKINLVDEDRREDAIPLAKRFVKGTGPRAPLYMNEGASGLVSLCEAALRVRQQAPTGPIQKETVEVLAENMAINAKDRKRKQVAAALAKRAPVRKIRSLGSVIVNTRGGLPFDEDDEVVDEEEDLDD